MQKRTSTEVGLLVWLLAGCTTMPWTETTPTEQPEPSAFWIQNPRAFAEDIANGGAQERARLRQQALYEFLKTPSTEEQVRLSVVYDASTQSLADGYSAADSLTHALGESSASSAAVSAVLTNLLLRMERRIDDLRAIASRDSELAALRDAYRVLEEGKAAADAQNAGVQRALRAAEAKLDALKSIEETLESSGAQLPAEAEPNGDGAQ